MTGTATKAPEKILQLCKDEVSSVLGAERSPSLQQEQLLSPVLKYLVAFSNQPNMCTETQVSKNLSIPRPMTKKVMEALEGYQVVEPIADFGTVKPYRVSRIATALKAAWVRFTPEEVQLLFGVRDSNRFNAGSGFFQTLVTAEDGTRWLPPMEAASSFFSAITSDVNIKPRFEFKFTAYHVDVVFLGRLLQDAALWPLVAGDLLLMEDGGRINEITEEAFSTARRRLAERYCSIYYQIAEGMLSSDPMPRKEYLSYMLEVLQSCVNVARTFGAQDCVQPGEQLMASVRSRLAAEASGD